VDFPIKNGGSFQSYVNLPEGNLSHQHSPAPPRSPKPILDHASDLLVSANDGVQLARLGVRDQVATVLVQGLPYFGRGTQNDGFQPLSKKRCLDDLMI